MHITSDLLEIRLISTVLVAIALIIIIGYISTAIFRRTKVPGLLILMLIGIFLVQVLHEVQTNYLAEYLGKLRNMERRRLSVKL